MHECVLLDCYEAASDMNILLRRAATRIASRGGLSLIAGLESGQQGALSRNSNWNDVSRSKAYSKILSASTRATVAAPLQQLSVASTIGSSAQSRLGLGHQKTAVRWEHSQREGEGKRVEDGKGIGQRTAPRIGTAGWSYQEACTWPNLVSSARALASPFLGYCIINESWTIAVGGTLLAGFSDWLDGYLAKRMKNQKSSLGSYLDPLADKVMVTCLTIATGYKGLIDPWVCGIIIGRDVVLLGGAFVHRAHVLNWKWKTWQEYFRVLPPDPKSKDQAPAAPMVKPIFLSKLNTVFQIGLVVSAISNGAVGWPDEQFVLGLGYTTAATTIASGVIYVRMYMKGKMLT